MIRYFFHVSPLSPRHVPALSPVVILLKAAWLLGFLICPRCPRLFSDFLGEGK